MDERLRRVVQKISCGLCGGSVENGGKVSITIYGEETGDPVIKLRCSNCRMVWRVWMDEMGTLHVASNSFVSDVPELITEPISSDELILVHKLLDRPNLSLIDLLNHQRPRK